DLGVGGHALERVGRLEPRARHIAELDRAPDVADVLVRRGVAVAGERERCREPAVRREIVRVEGHGLAVEGRGRDAIAGLRERGAAVEQHAERRRAVLLLHEDLGEAAIAAVRRGEVPHQVAELLLRLAQPPAPQALQARGEGDLVVEVSGRARHARAVCAVSQDDGYRFVNCGAFRARFRPGFLRSFARGSRVSRPAWRSALVCSRSTWSSARAMPCAIAPIWPLTPPPWTLIMALKRRAVFVTAKPAVALSTAPSSPKYSSSGLPFTTTVPSPGTRRTRAMDVLRRPVPWKYAAFFIASHLP